MVGNTDGVNGEVELVAHAGFAVTGGELNGDGACIGRSGVAGKGTCAGVELDPAGKRTAVAKGGAVGEGVAVGVGEGVGGNRPCEGRAGVNALVC